jgi:RNA recognition motif-containing protein
MSKKLYVGNLPFSTTADDLLKAFGNFGTVTQAQVVSDQFRHARLGESREHDTRYLPKARHTI